jgi:hypothetical protein
MFSMEWRLTLLAVGIFPLFLFPATKLGNSLRVITADNLDAYAKVWCLARDVTGKPPYHEKNH